LIKVQRSEIIFRTMMFDWQTQWVGREGSDWI